MKKSVIEPSIIIICTLCLVLTLAVILKSVFPTETETTQETSSPTPTQTTNPEEYTTDQKREVAMSTATLMFNEIMSEITTQLGAEITNTTTVTSSTLNEDTRGNTAETAILIIGNLPTNFQPNTTQTHITNFVTELATLTEQPWIELPTETENYVTENTTYATNIYEDTTTPANPTILEITFTQTSPPPPTVPETEIVISASIH